MNRRDIVILLWIIICEALIYRHLENLDASEEIITHFAIGLIILAVGLLVFVMSSVFIPQLGRWGDKKIFKKNG